MSRKWSQPVAVAFVAGALYLGFAAFATWAQNVTTGLVFWPAAGVTVALLLLTDRRCWPGILAAVSAAEIGWDLHNGNSLFVSVGWAVANTSEPLFSALLLSRLGKARPDLRNPHDLVAFLLVAAIAGPLLGGAIGGAVAAVGFGGSAITVMIGWGVGDALGVLTIAPFLLTWGFQPLAKAARPLEAGVLAGSIVVVGALVLQPWEQGWAIGLPYLLAPFLIWAGLRFEVRGAALAVFVVALAENAATGAGWGVFYVTLGEDSHVVLQIFLAVSAISALVLAAIASDLADRRASELRLTRLALYDGLTGVANRLLLEDRMTRALSGLGRHGGSVALLYVDLDGFKEINDTSGHQEGDRVLIETANRLCHVARATDTVARVGGDEFAVLLDHVAGFDATMQMVDRVRAILAGTGSIRPADEAIAASIGFGITDLPTCSVDELLARADAAMYGDKRRRREGARDGVRDAR